MSAIIYPEPIEKVIASIEIGLQNWGESNIFRHYSLSPRSLALLLLQKDPSLWQSLKQAPQQQQQIEILLTTAQNQLKYPVDLAIAETRQRQARDLEQITLQNTKNSANSFKETLHRLTVNPITGFPILLVILYFGIYKFVGEFGAGELVDRIEGFFERQINPVVNQFVAQTVPWQLTVVIGRAFIQRYKTQ